MARTYKQHRPGKLIALFGSSGLLELAIVNGNAAGSLEIGVGSPVRIEWD